MHPFVSAFLLAFPMARGALPPKPAMDLRLAEQSIVTRDWCMPSGLRISFQEDHSQPLVAVTMVIDKGSDADPKGKEGIAHVVEHLWFRSKHGDLPPVWDFINQIGGSFNAFTAADDTTYMTLAPRDALLDVMKVEASRIKDALAGVTEDMVTTEREVIRNEFRLNYENSPYYGLQYLYAQLYPEGHPYHDLGIGTHASLDNITLADVQEFVRVNYTAPNATVLIVGDVNLDEAGKYITQTFPKSLLVDPKNPDAKFELVQCPVRVSGKAPEPPNPVSQDLIHAKAGVKKPTVVLAWTLPGAYRADSAIIGMTSYLLTFAISTYVDGPDSVDWNPEDQRVSCGLDMAEQASTAMCFIELEAGEKAEKIVTKAVNGLYNLWDVENREWQKLFYNKAKAFAMAATLETVEEYSSLFSERATSTALYTHFTGNAAYFSESIKALSRVDAYAVAQMAEKYLNRKRYAAVLLEPYSEGDIGLESAENQYTGMPREPAANTTLDLAKVDAAFIKSKTVLPDLSQIRTVTLANGLKVVILPYGQNLLTRATLFFDGGYLAEPAPGRTYLSERYTDWMKGAPGVVMDTAPTHITGDWVIQSDDSGRYLGIYGSSGNLDAQLWLLRTLVQTGVVKKPDISTLAGHQWSLLLDTVWDEPSWWADRLANERAFPNHPLSRRSLTTEAVLASMQKQTQAEIEAWNRTVFQPANATLFLVGRLDPARAEAEVKKYFESWTVPGATGSRVAPPPSLPAPPARQVLVFDDPLKSQTQVTMRCPAAPGTASNNEARAVMGEILNEMLFVELRKTAGATYGAYGYTERFQGGLTVTNMFTTVQNSAAAIATQVFLSAPQKVADGAYDPKLLPLKKLAVGRSYVLDQQSTRQMLSRVMTPYTQGDDIARITGMPDRLAALTQDDIKAQASPCVGHEVVALAGPKAVVTPLLDKAGIAYEVVDWKAEADKRYQVYDPKGFEKKVKSDAKKAGEEKK